jgi:hypothetical protein
MNRDLETITDFETITDDEFQQLLADPLFEEFDSVGAILAFTFRKFGAGGLRECLCIDWMTDAFAKKMRDIGLNADYDRESLVDASDELALVGLAQAGEIVMQIAQTKASRFSKTNQWQPREEQAWRKYQERQRERWEQRRRYFRATGKRWKGGTMPPHVLASLPATN